MSECCITGCDRLGHNNTYGKRYCKVHYRDVLELQLTMKKRLVNSAEQRVRTVASRIKQVNNELDDTVEVKL